MTKLAARALAIVQALVGLKMLAVRAYSTSIVEKMRSGDHDAIDSLRRLYSLSRVMSWGGMAVSAIAFAVYAASRPRDRGRILAFVATGAYVVHCALSVYATTKMEADPTNAMRWLWAVDELFDFAALSLFLLALAWPRLRHPAPGAFALVSLAYVIGWNVVDRADKVSDTTAKLFTFAGAGTQILFGVLAFVLAAHEAAAPTTHATSGEGAPPFRLLAWSVLARIGGGLVVAIWTVIALKDGDANAAGGAALMGALVSIIGAAMAVVALFGIARSRLAGDNALALWLVMVLIALACVLDVWSASVASELYDTIVQAKKATSFWAMPSLKKMEEMQETVQWASRAQTVLGIIAMLVLSTALAAIATAAGRTEQSDRARRVRILVVVAGILALLAGSMMTARKPAGEELLLVAVVTLIVALWLLASWCKLLFGLANELESATSPSRGSP